MPELRFEADGHRYFLGSRELVGVTRSLQEAGLIDYSGIPQAILDRAAERGRLVHLALEYLDRGTLDEDSVSRELSGYVNAYRRFCAESGFVPGMIETFRYHRERLYAGRSDRPGGMIGNDLVMLDFKSGEVQEGHACQLAGYAHLFPHPRRFRRIALQLFADGRYRVHEYKPADFDYHSELFFRAVQIAQSRLKEMEERDVCLL